MTTAIRVERPSSSARQISGAFATAAKLALRAVQSALVSEADIVSIAAPRRKTCLLGASLIIHILPVIQNRQRSRGGTGSTAGAQSEIAFGAPAAGLEVEYARGSIGFPRAGCEQGGQVEGEGTAERLDDGAIDIEFAYRNGDEAVLKAKRAMMRGRTFSKRGRARRPFRNRPSAPHQNDSLALDYQVVECEKTRGARAGIALRSAPIGGLQERELTGLSPQSLPQRHPALLRESCATCEGAPSGDRALQAPIGVPLKYRSPGNLCDNRMAWVGVDLAAEVDRFWR